MLRESQRSQNLFIRYNNRGTKTDPNPSSAKFTVSSKPNVQNDLNKVPNYNDFVEFTAFNVNIKILCRVMYLTHLC